MSESLYKRIGGEAAVDAAVDLFYRRILADDRIRHFFDGLDMNVQRRMLKAFLAMVFGGPAAYTGRDLRAVHAPLKLNDDHFDAVLVHLAATLEELGVDAGLIQEAAGVAETTRNDVLDRQLAS